jgi:hypothetical protein
LTDPRDRVECLRGQDAPPVGRRPRARSDTNAATSPITDDASPLKVVISEIALEPSAGAAGAATYVGTAMLVVRVVASTGGGWVVPLAPAVGGGTAGADTMTGTAIGEGVVVGLGPAFGVASLRLAENSADENVSRPIPMIRSNADATIHQSWRRRRTCSGAEVDVSVTINIVPYRSPWLQRQSADTIRAK